MIKRYFLFLLLLLSVFSAANAEVITLPTECTQTDYYITIEGYDQAMIESTLSGTDWDVSAPVVTGISDGVIYVSSESDLARILSPQVARSQTYASVFPSGLVRTSVPTVVYHGYLQQESGTSDTFQDTYLYVNNTELVKAYSLMYKSCYTSYDGGRGQIYLNDVIWGASASGNPGSVKLFEFSVLPLNSVVHWDVDERWDWGADAYATVVIFGNGANNGTFEGSYVTRFTMTEYDYAAMAIKLYTEPGATILVDNTEIGVSDNAGLFDGEVPKGTHKLSIEKEGFWTYSENIDFQNDTELYIPLSPKNAIFQISKEFSGNIYPNSISTLSMDITPIKNAYAAKLRISGVEVNKVYYQTHEIPKAADGSYILGDVTSTQNIEIEFKTPSSWGEKTFAVEISATDIEGTAYTNLETIDYEVLELPFLLEMPETFGIGLNDITLTDQSGTAYSVLMVVYDSEGIETWSSSTNLLEYCDYTFEIPIDDAGDYTLELNAKSGTVKTYYSIEIIEPVTLITEELTANPGKVATVKFKISNPTSNVKYYTAELTCPFLNESINKTFSIAPETVDKTVDMSFEVPEELELENYQLSLKIYDPNKLEPIYSGNVVLTISTESIIFASVPGGNTTLVLLAAAILLIGGTFAALRLKK
ncbi:hypothetical protein HNP97_001406 [Methanococcus maripaludis]|uniref:PEGA domain-containing protein n=1 Tax=Methanococcus maripaludis TaxID=39152 RepID=A0A7J9S095_METMI|nr:hypothetical protein [Methanococcus maripaludis]